MQDKIQILILNAFEAFYDRIAIKQGEETYSFCEVKSRAISICNYLSKNANCDYVAVLCNDKFNTICSMLGILLSRKIFVLVEKKFPDKRKQKMLEILKCKYVIIDSESLCMSYPNCKFTNINNIYYSVNVIDDFMHQEYLAEDPIYVFFTSGTTGEPKAVIGKNKSLVHFILWEIETFHICEKNSFAQFTSVSHDPFLRDIFVPFLTGGTICISQSEYIIFEREKTAEFLTQNEITHMHCTPSMFKMISPYISELTDFLSLKYIFFAGEELKAYFLKDFFKKCKDKITFVNLYGPTETTMAKLYHIIAENDIDNELIPLGRPLPNTIVRVMKSDDEECDIGEEGELYIYTEYGTLGYTDLDYTMEKFIVLSGKTYYKTGDMAIQCNDGNFIFCGRKDNQVKIMGNRIDTSEIEKALLEVKQINDVLVIPMVDQITRKIYLCAYCIAKQEIDVINIKKYLYKLLPDYMIPSKIIILTRFPLTSNGKVDLKELDKDLIHGDSIECYNYIDDNNIQLFKNIWNRILDGNRNCYTIDDDFFLIGGDSFGVFEFLNILREEYNLEVEARDVFELRTIREISKKVKPVSESKAIKQKYTKSSINTFDTLPIQKQIYDLESKFKSIKFLNWNMLRIYKMTIDIPLDNLENYLNYIVERHDILRSYFEVDDSVLVRKVKDKLKLCISIYEANCSNEDLVRYIKSLTRKFELNIPLLLEAFIVKREKNIFFCINMHHIISDEKTFSIIIKEIQALYTGISLTGQVKQYNDFVILRQLYSNRDLNFWMQKVGNTGYMEFSNCKPTLNFEAGNKQFTINFNMLRNNFGLTRYMMCASVLLLLLYIETGQKKISFLTLHDLRPNYNLINTLGLFTHNSIIFYEFNNNITIKDYLLSVRSAILDTYEFQNYYYENLTQQRKKSGIYEHNVLLNYQIDNIESKVARIFEKVDYEEKFCNLDLICEITEILDNIQVNIRYKRSMFPDGFIDKLLKQYEEIINTLVDHTGLLLGDYITNLKI